jgi:thioredoxin reductase (NADPH)
VPSSGEHDVIIIGGGVAALTAAMFAAQLGMRTAVVADILIGGQILNVEEIVNYPGFPEPISGADLGALIEKQATDAGAEFVFDEASAITPGDGTITVSCASGDLVAPAVIVATGSSLRKLGVPGEERLDGRGVSYCGSCDAALFVGRPVSVVGGGDSAADEALVVAQHASEVVMLVREAQLHAASATRARVFAHDRIRVRVRCEPIEVLGDAAVSGLRVRDLDTGETSDVEVAGVFVFVGLEPNTSLLSSIVELDETGRVVTTAHMETAVPGLFAVGDIRRDSAGYIVNVASDGATAAAAAHRLVTARAGG